MNASLKAVLDKMHEDKALKDIIKLSPSCLQGVSDKDAQLLREAFDIRTIEDLGTNKFFLIAQALTALARHEK